MRRTIMVMAGGTGGHVYPGMAVADWLKDLGWRVVWLGTRNGMEARLTQGKGYEHAWLSMAGVRGKGALRLALLPFMLLVAMAQAIRAVFAHRPDVVLGMGGFAAFPGGMMAALLNRPLVIHEQNSVAGLTNRVLAAVADKTLVAFPNPFLAKREGISSFIPLPSSFQVVGNPVRADIAAIPVPEARYAGRQGSLRLLVVGGSLGAQALNETVPKALALLPENERPRILHQSGEKHLEALQAQYQAAGVPADTRAFLNDMATQYADCDLVICRAGALTVAELAAAGVPAILVPFPHAVDDHQTTNARFLSDAGAAVLMPQSTLTPESLAEALHGLTREKLLVMAKQARALGKPDATRTVAEICQELAK